MPTSSIDRRHFLQRSAALTTAAVVPYYLTGRKTHAQTPRSKNDRPHIALVGAGGRGTSDARQAARFGEVVAICDADLRQAEKAKTKFSTKADIYQDYRKVMDRQDIDVIVNGTPDHWHTAVNIAACQSEKDVYAEKPLTLTIDEGKILRNVVQETGRIIQVGTQQRSEQQFQQAVELVRNGRLGKLQQVWVALPYFTTQGGPFASKDAPSQLDWDLYQGQAPEHDYCDQRTHQNFRWWYEYAGGIVTDWGNHHIDIAHWGMDCESTGPTSIDARGIFPNRPDPHYYNTPDRFFSRMHYPSGVELLYFASLNERLRYGQVEGHQETTPEQVEQLFGTDVPEEITTMNRNGIMFIGTQGRVFVNRGGIYGKPVEQLQDDPLPDDAWRVPSSRDHMGNFFACVDNREEPVSPVRIQHRTITACHLTNISLRLGHKIAWDPKAEEIVGDEEAKQMQSRRQRSPYVLS